MRTLNILRNSAYSLISFACVALLGIFVRKFFTQYLPVELLGIEGLFSNIIAMLSLAELGVSAIISYNLYREIAKDNKKEINILMSLYRYVYTIIGSFIADNCKKCKCFLALCTVSICNTNCHSFKYLFFSI